MRRRCPRLTTLLMVASIQAPVASARPLASQHVTPIQGPAWPAAPARPRIRYLRTLAPETFRPRRSFLGRVWQVVTGGTDQVGMTQPYGVTVGADRRVYVADTFGHAVHVFDLEKRGYSTIPVAGDSLVGVCAIGQRLFVTDSASARVIALDLRGRVAWSRGSADGFGRPTGLTCAVDRLFVVDTANHRVAVLSPNGAPLGGFGTRGIGDGEFNYPTNITRGSDGRLYVSDTLNFRVQVFRPDGVFERAFGRPGDAPGDLGKAKGVALDSQGHVYVVEGLTDVVQMYDPDGRFLMAFGGSGSGVGQFWLPSGLAIVDDVVYVADAANRRVQMFEYVKETR